MIDCPIKHRSDRVSRVAEQGEDSAAERRFWTLEAGMHEFGFIPKDLHFSQSLDSFRAFYVNRFIDHHAFKLLEI